MLERRFATLDVFTDTPLAGNPLAVVLDADGLSAEAMQARLDEFMAGGYRALVSLRDQGVIRAFGGGINEDVDPVLVAGDGTVTDGTYPGHKVPNGGYLILELPSREAALEWAAKIAVACRCSQELREFQYDPAS